MASRVKDIKFGSVGIADFAHWINERHRIYLRKEAGDEKPWTDDNILRRYKFTNAFRQLDKGTVALQEMLTGYPRFPTEVSKPELLFFNIVWYRFFNWYEHAKKFTGLGFVTNYTDLEDYICKRKRTYKKIFTGAHMTTGVAFEEKHISYLRACKMAWDKRHEFTDFILAHQTMEEVFEELKSLYMVGKFIAYELVCDFRFTLLLNEATDKLSWANMGPGAQRGLKRLGLPYKNQQHGLCSMNRIYQEFMNSGSLLDYDVKCANVPFELREVEHSLCEFDKYCRVQNGEGRPRGRYPGEADNG